MALSWKQPYASLMLHGKIETRRWSTAYRGWVLICASKTPYSTDQVFNITGDIPLLSTVLKFRPGYCIKDMVLGKAIAIGRLVDCRPMQPEDAEKAFVEYYSDLFCHVYEDVQSIMPIPWKGTQGWKEVSMEVKEQISLLAKYEIPEQYKRLTDEEIYGDLLLVPIKHHKSPDGIDTDKT